MADPRVPRGKEPRNDVTAEVVRAAVDYDPDTGVFRWKWRPHICYPTNRRFAGKETNCINNVGYVVIRIEYRLYLAHRLAWLIMTGEWPAEEIDHINGHPADNRWNNLRAAKHKENGTNQRKPTNNTSGFKGVTWHTQRGRWNARIMKSGRNISLGLFSTPEAAYEAYKKAAAKIFGEFMREEEHL